MYGSPDSSSGAPTMSRRPPRLVSQNSSLTITSGIAPTAPSASGPKTRPATGSASSIRKYDDVAKVAGICRAGPSPVRVTAANPITPTSSKAVTPSSTSRSSGMDRAAKSQPRSSSVLPSATRRSASGYGRGDSRVADSTL